MTERPSHAVSRDATSFHVGPSGLHWDGTTLTIDIVETCMPIPRSLRGRVKVTPRAITAGPFVLNEDGNHRWWPIAPHARVEVEMREPDLCWQGDGYLDHNAGDAPVEAGFRDWQWARGITKDGAVVMYEGERRDGSHLNLARTFGWDGTSQDFTPLPMQALKRTRWGIHRSIRSESKPSVIDTVVDAPFYARSVVAARVGGEDLKMMHESLSLDRFGMPIVQAMLPFRMPRARR